MHPISECPHWNYEKHHNRKTTLPEKTRSLLLDLRRGALNIDRSLVDTRDVHRHLFEDLAPPGQEYLAGHYRGEEFYCLKHRPVKVPANPLVGCPPQHVRAETEAFGEVIEEYLTQLDAVLNDDFELLSPANKLIYVVACGCTVLAKFLEIHPYANGNGHIGRFCLTAFLGRYGYWLKKFPLEPRPPDPYTEAVYQYQNGNHTPLEKFVLECLV